MARSRGRSGAKARDESYLADAVVRPLTDETAEKLRTSLQPRPTPGLIARSNDHEAVWAAIHRECGHTVERQVPVAGWDCWCWNCTSRTKMCPVKYAQGNLRPSNTDCPSVVRETLQCSIHQYINIYHGT